MWISRLRESGALSMRSGAPLAHVWLTWRTSFVGKAAVCMKYVRLGSRRYCASGLSASPWKIASRYATSPRNGLAEMTTVPVDASSAATGTTAMTEFGNDSATPVARSELLPDVKFVFGHRM